MSAAAQRPLAIFGGTFDPVHIGHLRVALEAAEVLDAELRLIPARVPPHRPQPLASAQQRSAILRAALACQHRLLLDERELARDGSSYSIDTLIDIRGEIGAKRVLILLVGRDAFEGLPQWHRWRELFNHAHIGVLTRPGQAGEILGELANELARRRVGIASLSKHGAAGKIVDIAVSALDVSATALRALLKRGGDPRYLLPDAVVDDPALLAPYRANHPIPKS